MTAVELSNAAVFLDFDGTISTVDVGVHLLDRLATGPWHDIEDLYDRKEIGSRECVRRQWQLLPTTDERLLRAVADEVPIDPGFGVLVEGLRAGGAEVTVVSDGFGFYVWDIGSSAGVPVVTARVDWRTGAIVFPVLDDHCPCGQCGTCKQAPVRAALARGRTTVFVGDGGSDRRVAPLVDVLYAKDGLASWCDDNRIPYSPFATLTDVAEDLGVVDDLAH